MTLMSQSARNACVALALLPLAALGHDIYVWQTTGNPFAFAALGWMTKTYLADYHQMAVDTLSPENFNMLLAPILEQKAFFLGAGIEVFALVAGIVSEQTKTLSLGIGKNKAKSDKDKKFSYKRN
jgi:hypothetical protein